MDLIEKIGQLLIVGFKGTTVTNTLTNVLSDYHFGGVILFNSNIEDLDQLSQLTNTLQQIRSGRLFVSVDHEGGRVFRLPPPFTRIPAMKEVSDVARMRPGVKAVRQIAQIMATELKEAGFNLNYAPVLDVATNQYNEVIGDRAFGKDPLLVCEYGSQIIDEFMKQGVIPCGKHFPGHGDSSKDSHFDLPILPHTLRRLHAIELKPFIRAIASGIPMIMTGHLKFSGIDNKYPVTFSKLFIEDVLRTQLSFRGVVVSDDLCMASVAKDLSLGERVVLALKAGCDMPMVCHDFAGLPKAIEFVAKRIRLGELSETRIDESLNRINLLKDEYCVVHDRKPSLIGSKLHLETVDQLGL